MTQVKTYILYILATATVLLTGCADSTYLGDGDGTANGENKAIALDGGFKAVTRAGLTGADAADALGNQFIVNGFKFDGNDQRQDVFKNYTVRWTVNSAGTTTTNSSGWEYAGQTHYFTTPSENQTVKYWDWSQNHYNFVAYSIGKENEIQVITTNPDKDNYGITDETAPAAGTVYTTPFNYNNITGWPYFLRGSKDDLLKCYISDMTTVSSADFGKPVELKFRSLAAKVRVAFYETIPGYSVKELHFYVSTGATITTGHAETTKTARLFGQGGGGFFNQGTYKIFFPTIGSNNTDNPDYNRAHAGYEAPTTEDSYADFGTMNYTTQERREPEGNHYLGRSASTATFAGEVANDYYTKILPHEEQSQNIMLRVNYTLVSLDTDETIVVYGAQAIVPMIYARWQPNCAYTYIFKISDNSDGWTTPGATVPAGLYPITLDAVTIDDGYGSQETITIVAEPSITTYAKNSDAITDNQYKTGSNIYVVVDKAGTVQALTVDTNAKLYQVTNNTGTGTTEQAITEESVANALENGTKDNNDSPTTWTVSASGMKDFKVTTVGVPTLTGNTTIPAEDSPTGKAITVNNVSFTPTAAGTYAFEFIDTSDSNKKYYKVIKVVATP